MSESNFSEKLEKFKRLMVVYLDRRLIDDFIDPPTIDIFEGLADSLIKVRLKQDIYGKQGPRWTYRYPRNWWQMLKEQYAPDWFLQRWPVIKTEIVFDLKLLYPMGLEAQPIANVTTYRDGHEIWLEEEGNDGD